VKGEGGQRGNDKGVNEKVRTGGAWECEGRTPCIIYKGCADLKERKTGGLGLPGSTKIFSDEQGEAVRKLSGESLRLKSAETVEFR